MSHILSSLGGSGSTHIAANLLYLGQPVHVRPEIGWIPARFGQPMYAVHQFWHQELGKDGFELLGTEGYDDVTRQWLTFRERTLWQFPPENTLSLFDNMVDYVRWCQNDGVSLISENMAEFGVFSRGQIEGVVFVFRHPLTSYLAWSERYPMLVNQMGGVTGALSIACWAVKWAAQAKEYLACRRAGLRPIRVLYESVKSTCPRRLLPLFDGWRRGSRHPHRWSDQATELMRVHTDEGLEAIYGDRHYGWRLIRQ